MTGHPVYAVVGLVVAVIGAWLIRAGLRRRGAPPPERGAYVAEPHQRVLWTLRCTTRVVGVSPDGGRRLSGR